MISFELIKSTGLDFLNDTGFKVRYPFSEKAPWMLLVEIDINISSINLREAIEKALFRLLDDRNKSRKQASLTPNIKVFR